MYLRAAKNITIFSGEKDVDYVKEHKIWGRKSEMKKNQ